MFGHSFTSVLCLSQPRFDVFDPAGMFLKNALVILSVNFTMFYFVSHKLQMWFIELPTAPELYRV